MSNTQAPRGPGDRRLRTWRLAIACAALAGGGALLYWTARERPEAAQLGTEPPSNIAAQFAAIQGNVKTRGVGGLDWKGAEIRLPLRKSDLVRTYPSSSAEIRFFDETRVTVRPDSLITIEETSRDPKSAGGKVAWKVSSGEINYETARKDAGSTEALTPTFRLALEGNSAGTMRVGDGGLTAVAQHAGAANIETRAGEKIRLTANEGIRVDAAGRAGAKQVLPETPTMLAPGVAGVLSLTAGAPVTLSWAPTGAPQYRILVELKAAGRLEQVFDLDGVKGTTVVVPGLVEGTFVARVAGQTGDGVLGRFSPPVAFKLERVAPKGEAVATIPPPPTLRIEAFEARGNVLRLVGKTEPGARLLVNGDPVAVQADGSFREFVTLPRRQGDVRVVIRAISAGGGVAEETRTLSFGQ